MVYAIAYCPIERKDDLAALGFDDSKALTIEERERLFKVIENSSDYIGWGIYSSMPQEISESMLRKQKYNLNSLAHDITIGLIRHVLHQGVNLSEIYIDTVGPPDSYRTKLEKLFPKLKITVAKKADSLYPVVSAASICAKVSRDSIIENWKFVEPGFNGSAEFGSGYPSDPNTVKWLKQNIDPVFGYPSIIRFSWSTAEKLMDENCVSVVWPDEEEDTIEHAFSKAKSVNSKRDPFYTQLGITHVNSFP
jgi:ribonuclease H2 subunit A